MQTRDIVVIGASAGGREAIVELVQTMPGNFPAAIFIVWHMPPSGIGILPKTLSTISLLPAHTALDGAPIQAGHIYVAPVDHHLLLEKDRMRLTKGPKENRFRPAVDPLFRSAAFAFGPRVIGVILSGALNDGTSGLWAIKDRGGIALVQDPADARVPGMPESALENVQVDYCVPVSEMSAVLEQLVSEPLAEDVRVDENQRLEVEVEIARGGRATEKDIRELGEISEFTCPECHGSLWQMYDGKLLRFRCRTGHAYSAQALLEDLTESVEAMEWAAIRGIEESAVLMEHMARHLVRHGDREAAQRFQNQAQRTRARSELVRQAIITDEIAQSEPGSGTAPI